MARYNFGGTAADFLADTAGNVESGGTGTVWTAQTGGTRITDLLTAGGSPTTTLTAAASPEGMVQFQGPDDGTAVVWVTFEPDYTKRVKVVSHDGFATSTTVTALTTTVSGKVAKGDLFYNVKDYAAVGNGVTDDTQAFRDAASAAGTGTVIVPPGAYVLSNSVSYACTFAFLPGATFTNGGYITGSQLSLSPRDYDAMMGMGNFNVWLDGTSFSSPASNTIVGTLWRVLYDGTAGTFSIDQAGGPLSIGAGNGVEWNQTVTGAGSTFRMLEFRVEDASIYNNDKATLSLIAQAASGTVACDVQIVQMFGTGGSPSADVTVLASSTFTATTTSQRFQWTVDMPSTSSKTFGSAFNDCVKIRVKVPATGTFNVNFKQVKFERGPVRTDFSQIPLSAQYAYLTRYIQYAVVSIGSVATAGGQFTYVPIPFKSEMRVAPTITWSTVSGHSENNVASGPTATHIQRYGATAFISSTAAGAFNASGQQAKLDARI